MRTYLKSDFSRMFAGDLAAFGGPSTDEAVAGQIRAEQICLVLRNSPGMMAANACNATVLGVALWQFSRRNLRGAMGRGDGFRVDLIHAWTMKLDAARKTESWPKISINTFS